MKYTKRDKKLSLFFVYMIKHPYFWYNNIFINMRKIILTNNQVKEILRLYNEELIGSPAISVKLNINKQIVINTLKENGIEMGSSGRRFTGGKSESDKRHYIKNRKKRLEYFSTWQKQNQELRKEYLKEYREKNIDKIRKVKRDYERNRKHNDPTYKLIANFRTAIWTVLKENDMNKYGHYFDILKYSPDELVIHLENQFTEDMTWDNYGEWHVDHRLPISSFKFQEVGDNEFMRCWELNNLQPMWGSENIIKGDNIIY